jgi:hypothetical protein
LTRQQIEAQARAEGFGTIVGKSGKRYPDANGLAAEVERRLQEQDQRVAVQNKMQQDGTYGSLLKPFSQDDLNNDVVYNSGLQFGLDQGTQAINRQAAATGSQLSGATIKALTRFGNDYGSTKANDAYNRFNTTQSNTYNRLAGISGAGQQATNQVSSAGQTNAQYQGNNLIGAGNARGASAIAGANGFNNALSSGVNAYQNQQLINSLGQTNQYIPSSAYYANNDLLAP